MAVMSATPQCTCNKAKYLSLQPICGDEQTLACAVKTLWHVAWMCRAYAQIGDVSRGKVSWRKSCTCRAAAPEFRLLQNVSFFSAASGTH